MNHVEKIYHSVPQTCPPFCNLSLSIKHRVGLYMECAIFSCDCTLLHAYTLTTLVDCKQGNSSTTSQTNGPCSPVIHWHRLVKVVSMSCFTTAWSCLCLPFFHSDFRLATACRYSSSVISSLSFCCSLGSCLRRFEGGCWHPCFEADGGFLFSSSPGRSLRKFLNAVLSDSFHDPYGMDRCLVTYILYLVTIEQLGGELLASFPGPAQLFVACSTGKWGGPGIFSHVNMT